MKNKTYWLIISYATFIFIGLPLAVMTAIWPNIASSINTNIANVAIVSAVALVVNAIALTLSSIVLTKIGTRITMALGLFIQGVSLLVMVFANSLSICVLSAALLGFGSGLVDTASNYFVTVNYKAKNTIWLHAFWGIGSGLGPFVMAAALAKGLTYNQGYVLFFPVFMVFAGIIYISRMIEKKSIESTKVNSEVKGAVAFRFRDIFNVRNAFLYFACMFLADFLQNEVSIWYSSYVVEVYNISDVIAANMLTFFFVGMTLSRLISGFIVERFGIAKVIIMSIIIFIVAGVLFILNIKITMILYIMIFLFGFGVGPLFPLLINYSKEIFPENILQGVIGLSGSAAQLGAFVASAFLGFIVNIFSINILVYVVIISSILSLIIFIILDNKKRFYK